MPEETITFELIRKIQREEQRVSKLTKLPENFYENVSSYLQQKRKIAKERMDVLEVKNVERLIEDVFNRRERKILNMALITVRTRIPPENLTEEEKIFFDQLVNLIKTRRENTLDKIFREEDRLKTVVFKEDATEFIGSDLKTYGPFKKDDTAKIPKENARAFIERGVADEVSE